MRAGRDHDHGGGGAGRWVFLGFLAVAAYFLLAEHRAHGIQYLPFLLVALCPLMHLFHHHGHGGHREEGDDRPRRRDAGHDSHG